MKAMAIICGLLLLVGWCTVFSSAWALIHMIVGGLIATLLRGLHA